MKVIGLCCVMTLVSSFNRGQNGATGDPSGFELRGTATDPGTLQPVTDALVLRFKMPVSGVALSFADANALAGTTADASGVLVFFPSEFGTYRIEVRKKGYGPVGNGLKGLIPVATATINQEHPVRHVPVMLGRSAKLRGRVVDEETGEGVRQLQVLLWQAHYVRGQRPLIPGGRVETDDDGRFVAMGISPGGYIVGIRSRVAAGSRALVKFSEDDSHKNDLDYPQSYWPGGADLEEGAMPMTVASDASVSVGEVKLRRIPLYRARVSISDEGCSPTEKAMLSMANDGGWLETIAEVPCGSAVLLSGLAPGSYRIEAVDSHSKPRLSAHWPFTG